MRPPTFQCRQGPRVRDGTHRVMTNIDFDGLANAISPDQLAQALGAPKNGTGWHCPSPDHDDHDPSFEAAP